MQGSTLFFHLNIEWFFVVDNLKRDKESNAYKFRTRYRRDDSIHMRDACPTLTKQ